MWSRRRVLGHVAASGAAWWTGRLAWVAGFETPAFPEELPVTEPLRVGVVRTPEPGDVTDGLVFGTEEAQQSARLFRRNLEVTTLELAPDESPAAAGQLAAQAFTLLVSGFRDADPCTRVADAVAATGAAVLNAACRADALRGPRCAPHLFHVAASDTMYREAVRLVLPRGATETATEQRAVMWHDDLERFGAGQLNARFEARFGRPMTSDAWAAWMAMKIGVESFLRARTADSGALRSFLTSDAARFDGHKGTALSFRPWDRQLRQPLYIVRVPAPGRASTVSESPPPGSAGGDANARLDALAGAEDASTCRERNQ